MRTLRQICGVTILALAVAVSALGGEIDCPGVISPPPPPQTEATVTTSDVTTTVLLTIVSLIN